MRQQDITLRITYDECNLAPPHWWDWDEVLKVDAAVPSVTVIGFTPELDIDQSYLENLLKEITI